MNNEDMWALDGPSILTLPRKAALPLGLALPPTGSVFVARLDGAKLEDEQRTFEQFSQILEFPAYFGWNWDAFHDCLRDLSWRPADRYLIVIEHADRLLSQFPAERAILLKVLSQVAREWKSPLGKRNGIGIPFKVVMIQQ